MLFWHFPTGFVGATDKRKMPSFNENLVVVVALSPVETGT
jgi:hypothetical protein